MTFAPHDHCLGVRNDKNCRPRHQTAIWGLTAPVQDRDSFWSGQTLSRWCRVAITTSSVSKLNVLPAGVFCRANARLHTGADPQLPRTLGSVRRPIYVEYQCGTASTAIQKGEKNYSPAACYRRRIRRTGSREAQEKGTYSRYCPCSAGGSGWPPTLGMSTDRTSERGADPAGDGPSWQVSLIAALSYSKLHHLQDQSYGSRTITRSQAP
jgi:hypothetical protein